MSGILGRDEEKKLYRARVSFALIIVFLILVPLAVYWQVGSHEFVNFDDDDYIFQNYTVKKGLTAEGFMWAFSFTKNSYWHPLTWISHMLDCRLFGLDAGLHHLMNLLFHQINVLLLFTVLFLMTGAFGRSAAVAALFALHPVNVDTVAWVSERKNLLSTSMWLLTMLSYWFYTKKPGALRYISIVFFFILGTLAKPMLVTVPFVLMLLDYWPLKRFSLNRGDKDQKPHKGKQKPQEQGEPISRLIWEKVPLVLISLIVVVLSSQSIKHLGAVVSFDAVPMKLRIANAIVSYTRYLAKFIYPIDLTFYHPYPAFVPGWQVAGSAALLGALTYAAVKYFRSHPYGIVGWLWFLGTLVPVLGFIQGGLWPAIAERWAYVPFIGLYIIVSWTSSHLVSRLRFGNIATAAAGILVLGVFSVLTLKQAGCWHDDFTLCRHALKVNPENYVAHNNLGMVYKDEGKIQDAIFHYQEALRISPGNANAMSNLANAFTGAGRMDEAIKLYREALGIDPESADTHFNLGAALEKIGRTDEAARSYQRAFTLNPQLEVSYEVLGNVSMTEGKVDAAIGYYLQAVRQNGKSAITRYNLGNAYARKGDMEAAVKSYQDAVKLDKRYAEAYNNMGNALAELKKDDDAIACYKKALEIKPGFEDAGKNLRIVENRKGARIK